MKRALMVGLLVCAASGCGSSGSGKQSESGGATGSGGSAGANSSGGTSTGGNATGGTPGSGGGSPVTSGFTCTETTRPARAPTYYVDFDAGTDTADGKSKTTAWKHAPGDASATGTAASATLVAGDVVLFKGGVVYKGAIEIPASGSAGKPVVYDGNSAGSWGAGSAEINGELKRSNGFSLRDKSYVVIDSFVIRSFDKSTSSTAVSIDGGSNDEVAHCRISDVYYPTNPNPGSTAWESQSGNGIAVNNSPGTRIHHNSVRDVGNAAISFGAESGLVIDGGEVSCNEVTNMNWGIAVALGNSQPGTKLTGVKILGNYVHDFDQYYVASVWHRDGLFVFARPDTDQASVENLEIAYNYFEDNTSALGSTAWIYLEYVCKNFSIHHNILNASRSYYAIRIMGDGFQVAGNHKLYNNVIDNDNTIGDGMHMQESSGIQLENNIFYTDGYAYIVATSSMSGFAADYNLIYRVTGAGSSVALNAGPAENPGGDKYDFATLQSSTSYEQHGRYGDPLFTTDPAKIDTDPSGFAPKTGSPAIDHGTDLGFKSDFAGKPIPGGAAPDIGAFEVQ